MSLHAVHRLGLEAATRSLPLRYFRASGSRTAAEWARWDWIDEQMSSNCVHSASTVWAAVRRTDNRHRRVSSPCVVTVLQRDRVCPPALQREVASILDAHTIEVDADHDLPLTDPAAYARATSDAVA